MIVFFGHDHGAREGDVAALSSRTNQGSAVTRTEIVVSGCRSYVV